MKNSGVEVLTDIDRKAFSNVLGKLCPRYVPKGHAAWRIPAKSGR